LTQGDLVAVDVLRHVLGELVVNREFFLLLQQKNAGSRELFGDRTSALIFSFTPGGSDNGDSLATANDTVAASIPTHATRLFCKSMAVLRAAIYK